MLEDIMELVWPYAEEQLGLDKNRFVDMVIYYAEKKYITLYLEDGELTGAAFWLRVKDPENIQRLEESEDGDYLYCVYAVAKMDMLQDMLSAALERFPGAKFWCYERHAKGDERLRIWRIDR